MKKENLLKVQETIGYTFNNSNLLAQAFTRKSYSEENNGGNNEVLEFIGDKALDFAVIEKMMEKFGGIVTENDKTYFMTSVNEGKFTEFKKELVEKKALSKEIDRLGFKEYLLMGNGDVLQGINDQTSVKEDLFEAIIGAVAIDSNYNFSAINKVVSNMIDFDDFFDNIVITQNTHDATTNYVGMFQEWYQKKYKALPKYECEYLESEQLYSMCLTLWINGEKVQFKEKALSKTKAKMEVAKLAYDCLNKNGLYYTKNPYLEAIKNVNYSMSTSQVNELKQKKLIKNAIYSFTSEYNINGNYIWTSSLTIDGLDKVFIGRDTSKSKAQKECAYKLLTYLVNKQD